jgi:hypothetical protein
VREAPTWTAADLIAFTHHATKDVRAWAWRRLGLHHPAEAAREAPRGLADSSSTVVGRALGAVVKRPEGLAEALAAVKRRRDLPQGIRDRAARLLAGKREEEAPQDPIDVEIDRLASAPDELRRRAPELLASASNDDRMTALLALGRQPYRWATEALLARLDALLATDSYRLTWDTLAELGDPAALPAALRAWRPGDGRIATVVHLLHALAARISAPEPLPEALVRDVAEGEQRAEDLTSALAHGLDLAPRKGALRLDLRCTRCARAGEHLVGQAYIHPRMTRCREEGWDGVVLGRVVTCKHCGAEDEYELTPLAKAVLAMFEPPGKTASREERTATAVIFGEVRLWDGSSYRRPSAALRHLRVLAERAPDRGEGWRRLGNFNENLGRVEEAVGFWERAADDEEEMEACYSLTKYHADQGHLPEAFPWAEKTIARIHGARDDQPAELRREAAEAALRVLRAALPGSRAPLGLHAGWRDREGSRGKRVMVNASSVDLRQVRRWDRLVDLFASDAFVGAELTTELPEEPSTILARLLEGDGPIDAGSGGVIVGAPMEPLRVGPKPGRNDACTCGSGKKYKKCCGR